MDLTEKIIQEIERNRENINNIRFGEIKVIIQDGRVIRTELNHKIRAEKTA